MCYNDIQEKEIIKLQIIANVSINNFNTPIIN